MIVRSSQGGRALLGGASGEARSRAAPIGRGASGDRPVAGHALDLATLSGAGSSHHSLSAWTIPVLAAIAFHAVVVAIPIKGPAADDATSKPLIQVAISSPKPPDGPLLPHEPAARHEAPEQPARQETKDRPSRPPSPAAPRPVTAQPRPATVLEAPTQITEAPPEKPKEPDTSQLETDGPAPASPEATSSNSRKLMPQDDVLTAMHDDTADASWPASTNEKHQASTVGAIASQDMALYGGRLSRAISEKQRYPAAARRLRLEGMVQVRVRVLPSGALDGTPEVASSSGASILDREALRMVRAAAPFPPLPDGFSGQSAEFPVPISFELR